MVRVNAMVALTFEIGEDEATRDELVTLVFAKRLDVHCDVAQAMRLTEAGPVPIGRLVSMKTDGIKVIVK